MRFKKTICSLTATLGAATASLAVVACGSAATSGKWGPDALAIGYWPNTDIALALNAPIRTASRQAGALPAWIKGTQWEQQLSMIDTIKPLWDEDQMDEEYWRGVNGTERYVLGYERWLKQPQRDFIAKDSRIRGAEFDYNEGNKNERYLWRAEGGRSLVLENKGDTNYQTAGDLWQIRDMAAILRKAASSLDTVYGLNTYRLQAERITAATDRHFGELAKLQKAAKPSLGAIDSTKTTWASDDDPNAEKLLIISIAQKQTGSTETSSDTAVLTTPSMHKELYTKAHFTMPALTNEQLDTLNKTSSVKNDRGIVPEAVDNGVSFSGGLSAPFWSAWAGKVDKIIFGVPTVNEGISPAEIAARYPQLAALIAGGLNESNTLVTNFYLAGGSSYGFRMPIGQNTVVDAIAKKWYGAKSGDPVLDWSF